MVTDISFFLVAAFLGCFKSVSYAQQAREFLPKYIGCVQVAQKCVYFLNLHDVEVELDRFDHGLTSHKFQVVTVVVFFFFLVSSL